MATQSVRIGWRPYVNLTSVQAAVYLLDSYSGAAAAYSLRKLKSSYTGSAIRVRRSSDNTEQDIGFDSDGNLDTYSLSAFVGTGNGFVTTWYDQSGNGNNLIQTTAANQPSIILSSIINTQNGKPVLITDGSSFMVNNSVSWSSTTNSIFATIKLTSTRGYVAILSSVGTSNQHFVSRNNNGTGRYYDSGGQEITAAALPNGFNLIGIHENTSGVTVFENGSNLVTNFAHDTWGTITGIVVFRRDNDAGNVMRSDSGFAELIVYGNSSKLSDNSGISTNINSYYSAYPNPTSVWNLLAAAYNADTKSLPSLKTSLFAAYNGESNTNDSKGTNNGTPQGGLTYGTGKIGNAFNFNGSNSYVQLPNNSMNLTGDFTVSTWVNFSSFPSVSTIIANYYRLPPYSVYYGWSVLMISNQIVFDIFTGVNNSSVRLLSPSIPTNTWKHVTLIHKKNVSLSIYIDGVLSVSTATTFPIGYSGNETPAIGGTLPGDGFQYPTNGKIDAFNVWNKVLTQSEITELYNSGNGAQYITDSFYKPTTSDALNTYNGTAQGGLTYGVGKVGTAFQFNGTNSYILLPRNSLRFTNSFSVSLWTYSTANQTGNKGLFSDYYYPGDLGYTAYITTSNKVEVFFKGGYSINQSFTSNSSLSNNQWNNIVISWDKINTQWKMYINGVLDYTYTNGNANSIQYQSDIYENRTNIGAINSADSFAGSIFNGSIDALNIWNKVLTQSEVTELYNSGNGKQYPN